MLMIKLNMLKQSLVSRKFSFQKQNRIFCLILAHCIDKYTKLQVEKFQSDNSFHIQIDERLEDIVNRMFQRCFDDKKYKQVEFHISLRVDLTCSFRRLVLHLKHVELIYLKKLLKNRYNFLFLIKVVFFLYYSSRIIQMKC
jgi:hypothetical protein